MRTTGRGEPCIGLDRSFVKILKSKGGNKLHMTLETSAWNSLFKASLTHPAETALTTLETGKSPQDCDILGQSRSLWRGDLSELTPSCLSSYKKLAQALLISACFSGITTLPISTHWNCCNIMRHQFLFGCNMCFVQVQNHTTWMEILYFPLIYVLIASPIAVGRGGGGAKMLFLTLLLKTQGVIVFWNFLSSRNWVAIASW